MYFIEKEGIYECLPWGKFVWQKHGFGSRLANPSAELLTLKQIHSNRVWVADGLPDRSAEGDALIASQPGRLIGVRTADCVPLLLLDSRSRAVAAIHAGWRGTAACIAALTVQKLAAEFGSHPADLSAAIGPSIRACCYEVSGDVAAQFNRWPESVQAAGPGKPHVDLPAANCAQLIEAGLERERIFDSGLCTACQLDRFFSYRREPASPGRMLSSIARLA